MIKPDTTLFSLESTLMFTAASSFAISSKRHGLPHSALKTAVIAKYLYSVSREYGPSQHASEYCSQCKESPGSHHFQPSLSVVSSRETPSSHKGQDGLRRDLCRRRMRRSFGLGAPRHGIVFLRPAQRNVGSNLRAPEDWNTVSIARSISDFG